MTLRRMQELVRDQQPVMLPPTATVKAACAKMRERRVGAVLVVEAGQRLVGIFTGRDAVCRVLAEALDPATTQIGQVMSSTLHTVEPKHSAIDALRIMADCGVRHLPIVDKGRVVGIVSRADFRGLEQARLDEESGLWDRL